MNYLYHYTSLETLALILKNNTICFNNLLNVDDMEESKTNDMGNFGKYVYVSCWTGESEEMIPLWNLYTPNMHGVRIRLATFPFEKYHYRAGEKYFKEDTDSYIDYYDNVLNNECSITADNPSLIRVQYTNDMDKLYPIIKKESYTGAANDFINVSDMIQLRQRNTHVKYSFNELGAYKREVWKFQNEWRYKITIAPMGMNEMNPLSFQKHQEYVRRLENKDYSPKMQRIFLKLTDEAFNDFEVVFGPKMTEAERIMAIALLEKYAPNSIYRDSNLKIK